MANNKDPAFLLYSSDFLVGCSDLTMEERGQYITLLCLQHQKGHLTQKTICLSLGSVSDSVLSHFSVDEIGSYYNKRLDFEIEKREKYSESRRENGKKGGRPKKTAEKPYAKPYDKPYAKAYENHTENENENENKNSNGNGDGNKTVKRFIKPTVEEVSAYCTERSNGIDPQTFVDFYEAKGWRIGKESMKDWKAAVRTWEKRNRDDSQQKLDLVKEKYPEWFVPRKDLNDPLLEGIED